MKVPPEKAPFFSLDLPDIKPTMTDLNRYIIDPDLRIIADKISAGLRISAEEGLILYNKAGLPLLGLRRVLKERGKITVMPFLTGTSILNQQTNAFIVAVFVLTINRKAILNAGNTVMKKCLTLSENLMAKRLLRFT